MKHHIPVVRIETPEPDHLGATPNIFTHLTIDGAEWAVVGYSVDGSSVDRIQRVTLTFLADVTIAHLGREAIR
jgi:hypothetical protein